MNRSRLAPLLAALLVVLPASAGCDASFDAFEETNLAYSVFGVLDAAADTQFVRVEPVQDSTLTGSIGSEARVTTENLDTGETTVWQDTVSHLGSNDVPVHNFWTTANVEPEGTYRFRVERASGTGASTAEVAVPAAFPKPEVAGGRPNLRDTSTGPRPPTLLEVKGVERLGAVRADYDYLLCIPTPAGCNYVRRQERGYSLADTTRTGAASWVIEVHWDQHIPDAAGSSVEVTDIEFIYSFRVTVAAVSEDWPAYAEGDLPGNPTDAPLPPPGAVSNVENGTGFLGGAFTQTVSVPVVQKRSGPP
jgi:hypothetical protein